GDDEYGISLHGFTSSVAKDLGRGLLDVFHGAGVLAALQVEHLQTAGDIGAQQQRVVVAGGLQAPDRVRRFQGADALVGLEVINPDERARVFPLHRLVGVVHQHVETVQLRRHGDQLPAARRPAGLLLGDVADQVPGFEDLRLLAGEVHAADGAGGGDEVVDIAHVVGALHQLLGVGVEEGSVGAGDFLAFVVQRHQLQAAVAAQGGEGTLAHRVVQHAAGDGDFTGHGPGLDVDHRHRG